MACLSGIPYYGETKGFNFMRILCFALASLMFLFAAVQINDPDGFKWMIIYGVPALFALVCCFRPQVYHSPVLRGLLLFSMLAAVAGMIYYWPKSEKWSAREGMGLMITVVVLALIYIAQYFLRKKLSTAS